MAENLDQIHRAEIVRLDGELAKARAEIERLTQHGPWWMQLGLAKLHAEVDLTDPNDVIGAALTRAGFERVPVMGALEATRIELTLRAERDAAKAALAEACDIAEYLANTPGLVDMPNTRARIDQLRSAGAPQPPALDVDDELQCCPRFTWGDGTHDPGCRGEVKEADRG